MRTQENCRKGLHCIARVLEKITQQCTHSRPKGHEPTFVKFTFANDEQLALEIDITDQQPNRLTDAQTQSVEDCEDSAVESWLAVEHADCPARHPLRRASGALR